MDIQFWIWVAVIIISLIARANKKKNAQPPTSENLPDRSRGAQPKQPGAVTFEDLLREIQGEKVLSKAPPEKKEKAYEYVDYDDDIPDEVEVIEQIDYNKSRDNQVFESYEAAKKLAKVGPPSPGETFKVQDKVTSLEHFKEYDQPRKKKVSLDFLKQLKDPEGFKKAFIMSEILQRKY